MNLCDLGVDLRPGSFPLGLLRFPLALQDDLLRLFDGWVLRYRLGQCVRRELSALKVLLELGLVKLLLPALVFLHAGDRRPGERIL